MGIILLRVLLFGGFLFLVHAAVSAYVRREQLRSLDREYDAGAGRGLTREDFVARGMAEYDRSWTRLALAGIFAVPIVVFVMAGLLAN